MRKVLAVSAMLFFCGSALARMPLTYYEEKYAETASALAEWMETNLPEGLAVFELPESHQKRTRTTNMLERLHEEINENV
jgi:transposase-like protein